MPLQASGFPRYTKLPTHNARQLRLEVDPTPLLSECPTLEQVEQELIDELLALKMLAHAFARVPSDVHANEPNLIWDALHRLLRKELPERFPRLAGAFKAEAEHRKSPLWPALDDVRAASQWYGPPILPPPPEPEKPAPSAEYVAACKLVISACHQQSITLHAVDPLRLNAPPTAMLSARASGPADVDSQVARIQAGYLLGWAPTGRRLVPPKVEIVGYCWRELPGGTGVVLAAIENEAKPSKAERGGK